MMTNLTSSVFVCVITVIISSPVLAVIEAPVLTINGNSNLVQNLTLGSAVEFLCTVKPNYVVKYLYINRIGPSINNAGNRIQHNTNITCKDNGEFYCSGDLNGSFEFSAHIQVNVPCPPTPDKTEPVVYIKQPTVNDYYGTTFKISGYPKPTFTGMKVTSQGPVSLPIGVSVRPLRNGFDLYFRNYTEKEYGTYLIKAENVHGVFTANITYRGIIANPSNLVAWSTSPNSVYLKFRAGETFDVAVAYRIYYWIDGETSTQRHTVTNAGDAITATLNYLNPGITYNIIVQADHPKYDDSLYSNAATVTTIKQGDPAQPEPDNTPQNVPPTTLPSSSKNPTNPTSSTNPKGSTPSVSSTNPKSYTANSTSSKHPASSTKPQSSTNPTSYIGFTGVSEGLGFGAGIGIGLGVGLMIAITVLIVTIVCVKRRNPNTKPNVEDNSLQQCSPVQERTYENIPPGGVRVYENIPPRGVQHIYDVLKHNDAGGGQHNTAFNRK